MMRIRAAVTESPEDYIAQELVELSTHATVVGDELAQRHVDLRPFVFLGARRRRARAAGRADARGVRRGRARRQLVAERRRQGHLGPAGLGTGELLRAGAGVLVQER